MDWYWEKKMEGQREIYAQAWQSGETNVGLVRTMTRGLNRRVTQFW